MPASLCEDVVYCTPAVYRAIADLCRRKGVPPPFEPGYLESLRLLLGKPEGDLCVRGEDMQRLFDMVRDAE